MASLLAVLTFLPANILSLNMSRPLCSEPYPAPACGVGHLVSRTSRHGKVFYACDGYPRCKYVVNEPPVAGPCPECGWPILVEKSTRHGKRVSCPQKLCHYQTDI